MHAFFTSPLSGVSREVVTYLLLDTDQLASIASILGLYRGKAGRVACRAGVDYLGPMSSRRLGQAPARWPWRLSLTLVLGLALSGTTYILAEPHRCFVGEAEAHGWLLEGGSEDVGLFSSTIRGARLSWQSASGVAVDIERIEIRYWPWLPPRVTVFDMRVHLRGETVTLHS